MTTFKAVATCGFGLESVLAFEIRRLGMQSVEVSDGRITFDATGEQIAQANIWLRTAERVLIILAQYTAETFDELFDGAQQVRWGDVLSKTDAFPVKGYTMQSVLTSVPACQSIIKKSVVERMKKDYGTQFLPENERVSKRIQFSIVKDMCTIMLDTSGDGLHKRGYRPLMNEAPIKETLGAGICDFAHVFPESCVVDPFCGSGTLVIEAALRAKNIAPGLNRIFAGEGYSFLGDGVFKNAKAEARLMIRKDAEFIGFGSDIDPEAIAIANANAKRAGVSDCVSFDIGNATELVSRPNDIIIANPPYGERLMSEQEVERLYTLFGRNMSKQKFKGLYLISSHPEFEKCYGKRATKRRKLYNGMLPCQLFMYY
ncbi:MAG: class I SAM-dependent RNA methyltransferase [Oscillospiraceae bacterium]